MYGLNAIGFDVDITGVDLSVDQERIVDWTSLNIADVNDIKFVQ